MIKNMGTADRIIRTIIALVIGALIIAGTLTGLVAVILGIFAVVFLLTRFTREIREAGGTHPQVLRRSGLRSCRGARL